MKRLHPCRGTLLLAADLTPIAGYYCDPAALSCVCAASAISRMRRICQDADANEKPKPKLTVVRIEADGSLVALTTQAGGAGKRFAVPDNGIARADALKRREVRRLAKAAPAPAVDDAAKDSDRDPAGTVPEPERTGRSGDTGAVTPPERGAAETVDTAETAEVAA